MSPHSASKKATQTDYLPSEGRSGQRFLAVVLFMFCFFTRADNLMRSQLDLPSQSTVGVKIWEATKSPDGEDVSIGGVAYSTALVEYTCNVFLQREKEHALYVIMEPGTQWGHINNKTHEGRESPVASLHWVAACQSAAVPLSRWPVCQGVWS